MFHHLECWEVIREETIDWNENIPNTEPRIRHYWLVKQIGTEQNLLINKENSRDYRRFLFIEMKEIK